MIEIFKEAQSYHVCTGKDPWWKYVCWNTIQVFEMCWITTETPDFTSFSGVESGVALGDTFPVPPCFEDRTNAKLESQDLWILIGIKFSNKPNMCSWHSLLSGLNPRPEWGRVIQPMLSWQIIVDTSYSWNTCRRYNTGFGIWDLPQKSSTKAKFGTLGLNWDFFGTIFIPFWDF